MKRIHFVIPALVALGCATLADEAGDEDAVRPNALAGPFRYLTADEVDDAPYLLKKKYSDHRDPTVLAASDGTSPVVLYVVATVANRTGVFRHVSKDGTTFPLQPEPAVPVLEASEAFEGGVVAAPAVARVAGEVWLAYQCAQGVAIARSADGVSFQKPTGVSLGIGGEAWEGGAAPAAPALLVDGERVHLFYSAAGQLGEAVGDASGAFTRSGPSLLAPGAAGSFDAASVGDPEPWLDVSAEGRVITRVYYSAESADGTRSIGLAARFGTTGPLTRAPAPTLTGPRGPEAPAVLPRAGHTLLFVTQRAGASDSQNFPAIAAGVAPATIELSKP